MESKPLVPIMVVHAETKNLTRGQSAILILEVGEPFQGGEPFQAGRLCKYIHEWQKLTRGSFILDIVEHCHVGLQILDLEI